MLIVCTSEGKNQPCNHTVSKPVPQKEKSQVRQFVQSLTFTHPAMIIHSLSPGSFQAGFHSSSLGRLLLPVQHVSHWHRQIRHAFPHIQSTVRPGLGSKQKGQSETVSGVSPCCSDLRSLGTRSGLCHSQISRNQLILCCW